MNAHISTLEATVHGGDRPARWSLPRHYFRLLSPLLLGLILLISGIDKIAHLNEFMTSLNNRVYLPQALVWAAILFVPGVEIVCGFALFARLWLSETSFLTGMLIFSFIFVTGMDFIFPQDVKAGCGCMTLLNEGAAKISWFPILHVSLLAVMTLMNFQVAAMGREVRK